MTELNFPLSVLLVDDDKNICRTLALSLAEMRCEVTSANNVDEAIKVLQQNSFDLILTDFKMEGKTGLDLVVEAKKLQPEIFCIVMTAYSSLENAVAVVREGAFDYLPKPFANTQLLYALNKVRKFILMAKEVQDLKNQQCRHDFFSGFTSKSHQKIEQFIRAVAPTDGNILLTGESGTGKSELAKLIHRLSPRAPQPVITVYCTTLTESLVESELFGHVKGSFTGAIKDKAGKLELAHKGTLFLDEIGDLSLSAQSKLLRFLQDRVFERVGANKEILVDARIIAATNKNLPELVQQGSFREDLYYRLNALECTLLPLRERMEDLQVLITRILSEIRQKADFNREWSLPSSLEEVLLRYRWPGNIRELRNVLERLVILSHSKNITIDDLPTNILKSLDSLSLTTSFSLEEMERQHIAKILLQEPNLEKASQLLGITSVTLWRKRKQFGL